MQSTNSNRHLQNGEEMTEITQELLKAPESQLAASMKPLIEKWSDPPSAIEILEVLDHCVYASLASGFVVTLLQILYDDQCKKENTTHEEVIKNATWRNEG